MKGLVLKILRGNYPAIPAHYSQDLKDLLADMLIKDPVKRPSMRKVLEKEFLSKRISKLLTTTIAKNEFTSTFINRHLCITAGDNREEDKEQCNDISTEGQSQESNQIQTSKPKLTIKQSTNQSKKIRFSGAGPTTSQQQPTSSSGNALQGISPGLQNSSHTGSQSQQQLPGVQPNVTESYDHNQNS
jgi:NIMA (never in mitosis gene a)-related kinase